MKSGGSADAPSRGLRMLLAVAVLMGVCLRFSGLGAKVYWVDETYTSLQLAGYTEDALVKELVEHGVMSFGELDAYQRVDSRTGLADALRVTIREHPEHPPLYYMLAWAWARWVGSSVVALRFLSASIGVLEVPCAYWLGLELFGSALAALIGAAFVALSPLLVLYSQEVREYSLWTVTILISTALLARAMRHDRRSLWMLYAMAVAVGLYTHLYFAYVSAAQTLGVAIHERVRPTRRLIGCLAATAAAWLLWVPWICVVVADLGTIRRSIGWQSHRVPLSYLLKYWGANLTRAFVDFGVEPEAPVRQIGTMLPVALAVGLLTMYGLYFLWRTGPRIAVLLVLTLVGLTPLPFVLADLALGGVRSIPGRYMIPSFLGLQLALAYLFAVKLGDSTTQAESRLWPGTMVALLTLGLASDLSIAWSPTWWTKVDSNQNLRLAEIINRSERPLVISDIEASGEVPHYRRIGNLLSLSHLLRREVGLLLVGDPRISSLPPGFTDIYLFLPSRQLRSSLEAGEHVRIVCVYRDRMDRWLWKAVEAADGQTVKASSTATNFNPAMVDRHAIRSV